jgi:argininosuccinate lyase
MSPRHFVEVRRTLGGPAPAETARALEQSRAALERDTEWLTRTSGAIAEAQTRLHRRSQAL